jgi:hypothetical protein
MLLKYAKNLVDEKQAGRYVYPPAYQPPTEADVHSKEEPDTENGMTYDEWAKGKSLPQRKTKLKEIKKTIIDFAVRKNYSFAQDTGEGYKEIQGELKRRLGFGAEKATEEQLLRYIKYAMSVYGYLGKYKTWFPNND